MTMFHVVKADNFTSLYLQLMKDLINEGKLISPRSMPSYELLNTSLVLTNPRERILYSEVRKHNYTYGSAELLWYMAATDKLSFIEFYLPRMREYSDDGDTVNSAYGYRIFGKHRDFPNQWRNVKYKLLVDRDTRQAIITIHYQRDIAKQSKDVPCTLNLHFLIRDNRLHMFTQMRSNDAYMGLIYDVFSFTLLQEHMFNFLKSNDQFKTLELGTYVHRSDSMHLYQRDVDGVSKVIDEWRSDKVLPRLYGEELVLDSEQLKCLMSDERYLREVKLSIPVNNYTGICRFMAEKLNRILVKK